MYKHVYPPTFSTNSNLEYIIQKEIRRWHPDKFVQKFSYRIEEEERDCVLQKVKEIAQLLINYGKKS